MLLMLPVIGCGGGDDDAGATSPAPTLSKAQFLKMGSEICRRGNDRMTAAYGRWERANTVEGKRPPEAARDKALGQIVLVVRADEVRRLRALGLPREGEQFVKTMLTAIEEGIEEGEQNPSSLQASNEYFAFAKAFRMGIDYGLSACWLG